MSGTIQSGRLAPLDQIAFDNSQAGANGQVSPAILIAQALNNVPLGLYPAYSVTQVQTMAGRGSCLDRMFQRYFKLDSQGPIYVVPLQDAVGAAAAQGFILFSGAASSAGTIAAYIAGQVVNTGVNPGDNAVTITANVVASINGNQDLPVTALAIAAADMTLRKVQITSRHAGLCGNLIDIRFNYYGIRNGETLPVGVGAVVTPMSGGTVNPMLAAAYALIADAPGRIFVDAYTDSANIAAVAAAFTSAGGRWATTRRSWGHRFTSLSLGVTALLNFGAANDDPHSSYFAYETGSPTPEWEAAGIWAGSMAISLRNQPNQPVQTLPLIGFLPAAQAQDTAGGAFSATTREFLLEAGLGCARYDRGMPQIVRAVTNYTTNSLGVPDESYQDTEDMFLLMEIADRIEAMENQKLPRALLAQNGTKVAPGISMITPNGFLALMVALYTEMEFDGLVDDATDFIAASTAAADSVSAGQLNVLWAPYLVVGLRQIANTIQFRKLAAAAQAVAS